MMMVNKKKRLKKVVKIRKLKSQLKNQRRQKNQLRKLKSQLKKNLLNQLKNPKRFIIKRSNR